MMVKVAEEERIPLRIVRMVCSFLEATISCIISNTIGKIFSQIE